MRSKSSIKYKLVEEVDKAGREKQAKIVKTISNYKKLLKTSEIEDNHLKKHLSNQIKLQRGLLKLTDKSCKKIIASYKGVKVEYPLQKDEKLSKSTLETIKNAINIKLRNERSKRRKSKVVQKNVGGRYRYELSGGVHTRPGFFAEVYPELMRSRVQSDRKPDPAYNHIGVEFEFFCPYQRDDISQRIIDAKLSRWVRIKTDLSIKPRDEEKYGWEVCMIAPEDKFDKILSRVCDLLADIKAEVNETCGLHVHIDCRNRNVELIYNNMYKCQELFYSMIPSDRRTNRYCFKQTTSDWKEANGDHYAGINKESYRRHKTIEIRTHEGCVEYDKISAWVKLLVNISHYNEKIQTDIKTVNSFKRVFKPETKVSKYIENCLQKYA